MYRWDDGYAVPLVWYTDAFCGLVHLLSQESVMVRVNWVSSMTLPSESVCLVIFRQEGLVSALVAR